MQAPFLRFLINENLTVGFKSRMPKLSCDNNSSEGYSRTWALFLGNAIAHLIEFFLKDQSQPRENKDITKRQSTTAIKKNNQIIRCR